MKARVKETGKIFDVYGVVNKTCDGYGLGEVELMVDDKDSFNYDMTPAYWEKLRHEYAGMAMQGMLSNAVGFDAVRKEAADNGINNLIDLIAGAAIDYATALVNKLKEERK